MRNAAAHHTADLRRGASTKFSVLTWLGRCFTANICLPTPVSCVSTKIWGWGDSGLNWDLAMLVGGPSIVHGNS